MSVISLSVHGIVKHFPGVTALKGVDFDVRAGEVHALCGENGAGKSTLMHILAGVYKQDEGKIFLNGKEISISNQKHANDLGIAIVYQDRSLVDGMNVAENIMAARQPTKRLSIIDKKRLYKETSEILSRLKIDIDPRSMVGTLSPAMQQMVEIAKALSVKPNVLILDEPTATISEKEVGALFNLIDMLKKEGMAIIYISHRLAEIFKIADRVTVFKDGKYVETADTMRVNSDWLVSRMVGRELMFSRIKDRKISDEVVLECKNLTGERFTDVNFKLKKGEIISLAGLVGAGRTEICRAVFGVDRIISGDVFVQGKKVQIKSVADAIDNGIGYLPEDRKEQGLFLEMSIEKNIISASIKKFIRGLGMNERKMLDVSEDFKRKLNIVTPSVLQKVVNLSGGNQQKVVIAKWLLVAPDIILVDEPTRGIDVGAKAEIYTLLRELANKGKSVIIVSSELPEVLSLSDRIYVIYSGKVLAEIDGSEATEEMIIKYASGINN